MNMLDSNIAAEYTKNKFAAKNNDWRKILKAAVKEAQKIEIDPSIVKGLSGVRIGGDDAKPTKKQQENGILLK